MPLSSALRIFGVWSGSMALAESRPVDVCQLTIYGLNSGVFLSTLLHCLILTVAWFGALSRACLHAYLPRLLLVFLPSRICASVCYCHQPIAEGWTVFHHESGYRGALSRRLHDFTAGRPWTTTSVHIHLFECPDTVLPYSL